MCTAVTYKTKDFYFGRTLDYEHSFGEKITITPRNFPFTFRKVEELKSHYAIIGMATIVEEYPLYFDATNEKGLSMAGLNFPGNADYKPYVIGKENVAPFELIPWILGQCATVKEAKEKLTGMNLLDISFSESLPLSPLHWIISDRNASVTLESVKEGLKIYDNPMGVLTNNPPFDMMQIYLSNFMGLTNKVAENRFAEGFEPNVYSRGLGAMGLPGDLSSASRFVKAAFTKMNSVSGESEAESISQFFHILGSVTQQRGCVMVNEQDYEITIYTSCCNTDKGIYYYTTYENSRITGVDMHKEDLDGYNLISYPLMTEQQIYMQN